MDTATEEIHPSSLFVTDDHIEVITFYAVPLNMQPRLAKSAISSSISVNQAYRGNERLGAEVKWYAEFKAGDELLADMLADFDTPQQKITWLGR